MSIRPETLLPANRSERLHPTGDEVRLVVKLIKNKLPALSVTGSSIGLMLGLGVTTAVGSRTFRRWVSTGPHESTISYPAWAILCHEAGFERIWHPVRDLHNDEPFNLLQPSTLVAAQDWEAPTGNDVRAIATKIEEITGIKIAEILGLSCSFDGRSRTFRRWSKADEVSTIPYAAWALMVEMVGKGVIWDWPTE